MKCPRCGKNISDKEIAKHLASKGGQKSKRSLTKEQAQEMVKAREEKRIRSSLEGKSKNNDT